MPDKRRRARSEVVWLPEALRRHEPDPKKLRHYQYVVLEERVDDRVELLAWPWPVADAAGHLAWPEGGALEPHVAAIDIRLLQEQVYRPSRVKRTPRLGDVYAAAALGDGWDSPDLVTDARQLFEGPLYDISADAREAAKLSYLGALAPVSQPPQQDAEGARLLADAARQRERSTARPMRVSRSAARARRGGRP